MCSDDFEGGGTCGAWTPQGPAPSTEWSADSTSETGNAFYTRADGSGTTGAWNNSKNGNSYGDTTISANLRVQAWNGTGSDQATMYTRFNPTSPNGIEWYSVSLTSDGWIHIRRNFGGTVTNLLDLNNINVQPGKWFNLRVEAIGSTGYPLAVALNVYLDGAFQGAYIDTSVDSISSGYIGFGSFGATIDIDDIVVGDAYNTYAPAYNSSGSPTDCTVATGQPHICQESGQVSRFDLQGLHPWWIGKVHSNLDMWAMNYGFDVFGKAGTSQAAPSAKRGL
jgi:hypothetical protein